jgi:DNA polymerase-3 subunit beta
MSLISDRASNGIDIAISGDSMKVEAASPDNGEGAEEVQVDLSGSPVSIRVSPRYLLDALSAPPDDELNMLFGGALDPIVVKPATDDRFVAVVMPMR